MGGMKAFGVGVFSVLFGWFPALSQKHKSLPRKQENHSEIQTQIQNELVDALTQSILGYYSESRILLLRFTQQYPHIAEGHFRLAEVSRVLGLYTDALESARRAVHYDPSNKFYHQFLAELLLELKMYKEAEAQYQEMVERFPQHTEYLEDLADLQIRMFKMTEALKNLEKLEAQPGKTTAALVRIYGLFMKEGRYKEAYRTAYKLLQINPQSARYHGMASDACRALGDQPCALEHLRQALRLDSLHPQAQLALAYYALESKDFPLAIRWLGKAFRNPTLSLDEKMMALLGLLENQTFMLWKPDTLLPLLQILKEEYPEEARVYSAEGDYFMQRENYPAALQAYQKAVTYDKSRFPLWRQILFLCMETGKFPQAIAYADTVYTLNPVAVEPLLTKAMAYLRMGDFSLSEQVLTTCEWAVEDNPPLRSRWLTVKAEWMFLQNRLPEALDLLDQALLLDEQNRGARVWKARLLCASGKDYQNFNTAEWPASSPLAQAVKTYCFAGPQNATQILNEIEKLNHSGLYLGPLTLEVMGDALLKSGLKAEAVRLYERGLQLAPLSYSLQHKLREQKP
ncbi:MAG: tetratricopeptide repeat protein [Flavobacteriales bacterium]|nr:tetratricopeptide repeat protein [Flavobacteriales bacterium]MCX7768051.1 tetratricopeptide repeat protein [Flavobacteriales bacterium]MDW8409256.1 tetratricopeptide repeat protein [Flavobacteriales bacterium]